MFLTLLWHWAQLQRIYLHEIFVAGQPLWIFHITITIIIIIIIIIQCSALDSKHRRHQRQGLEIFSGKIDIIRWLSVAGMQCVVVRRADASRRGSKFESCTCVTMKTSRGTTSLHPLPWKNLWVLSRDSAKVGIEYAMHFFSASHQWCFYSQSCRIRTNDPCVMSRTDTEPRHYGPSSFRWIRRFCFNQFFKHSCVNSIQNISFCRGWHSFLDLQERISELTSL